VNAVLSSRACPSPVKYFPVAGLTGLSIFHVVFSTAYRYQEAVAVLVDIGVSHAAIIP
jgi:hypothetical protein